jgi:hypothetical protein
MVPAGSTGEYALIKSISVHEVLTRERRGRPAASVRHEDTDLEITDGQILPHHQKGAGNRLAALSPS